MKCGWCDEPVDQDNNSVIVEPFIVVYLCDACYFKVERAGQKVKEQAMGNYVMHHLLVGRYTVIKKCERSEP